MGRWLQSFLKAAASKLHATSPSWCAIACLMRSAAMTRLLMSGRKNNPFMME
jgi:hypothetical protein